MQQKSRRRRHWRFRAADTSRFTHHDFGWLPLAFISLLLVTSSTGCSIGLLSANKTVTASAACNCDPSSQSSASSCCEIKPSRQPAMVNSLPQISFESRGAIFLPEMNQSISGWPVGLKNGSLSPQIGGTLRQLTTSECERIASSAAPISREIESHRNWLAANSAASSGFIEAMNHQAAFERNQHAGRSLEAMLNLADIYSQQPTLNESHDLLNETKRAIDKIRSADVPVNNDTNEIDRQHLQLEEQATDLQRKQQQLTQGLELLLELDSSRVPIWTEIQDISMLNPVDPDCESAYQVALSSRSDLKALETLAADCNQLSSKQFAAIAAGSSPLLGSGLPLPPTTALWWQCKLKEQVKEKIECIKAKEAYRRREQMVSLAENKRKQIKREVCDAVDAISSDRHLLNLKQKRYSSLAQTITSAEKAKDEVPLDVAKHLQNRLELKKLQSEMTHQHFLIAIDRVKLRQAQGTLGQGQMSESFSSQPVMSQGFQQSFEATEILTDYSLVPASSRSIVLPNNQPILGSNSRVASPAPKITVRK